MPETSQIGLRPSKSKKSRAKPWIAADFETITDPNDARVWAWGVAWIEHPDDVVMDNTIEGFVDYISMQDSITFFHNLRFDGTFILDYILRLGYVQIEGKAKPKPGEFKALISHNNKFYSITIAWENGVVTEFRDSAKKFPGMSIASIARTFGMEEGKGEIDYHEYRAPGHVLTHEEQDYLRRDVSILAHALATTQEAGMTRLTVGSDAMFEYKLTIGDDVFDKRFPQLSYYLDAELRRAYRGGFTYADPRFQMHVTGSGHVLDVNSLYPYVMYEMLLPYGDPEYVPGKVEPTKSHPLTIFSITFMATIKPNHIPCIQIKGNSQYTPTEYLTEISEPTTLMMTNVDFDLYNDHYDLDILEYNGGWRFKAAVGMFDEYIEKWSEIKANSQGGERLLAKYNLNNLYGKFGTNPNMQSKTAELIDNKVKLTANEPETANPVYIPIAVFVTSYGRDLTIRAAQANYATFAYADTDSLHLLQDDTPTDIEVDPDKMGAWKREYSFDSALYVRAKLYLEHRPDKEPWCDDPTCEIRHDYENAFAGLPDKVSGTLTFDDIVDGAVFHGKLIPEIVPGGVVLKDMKYELKL